jgi:predicted transcriptional regulator
MENRNSLSDLMEDMEPGVLSFIRKHVRSFPRWDLLKFLHQNQSAWNTVDNLARYVGRQVEQVETEVTLMAKEELLRRDEQGSDAVFSLTQDPETLALIGQLISASQDRTFRMKLVYHILRAGGSE